MRSAGIISLLGASSPSLGIPEWVKLFVSGVSGIMLIIVIALQRMSENRSLQLLAAAIIARCSYQAVPNLTIKSDLPPSLMIAVFVMVRLLFASPLAQAL